MKSIERTNKKEFKLNHRSFLSLENADCDVRIETVVENAAKIIPPVWPLQTFIACNPLHGIESLKFEDAIAIAEFFFNRSANHQNAEKIQDPLFHRASDVNRELIKWCHAFLDEGQATITMPGREKGFYKAWSLLVPFDKNLHSKSSEGRALISSLPATAEKALLFCLDHLAIPKDQWEDYLRRTLAELPGWAGYIKWRTDWQNKKADLKNPITLVDFLAVRLVITCLLFENRSAQPLNKDYSVKKAFKALDLEEIKTKEDNYLKELLKNIIPQAKQLTKSETQRQTPDAQLIFCIDVRSEPLRLRIENQGNYETFGFAGFFGLPVCVHSYKNGKVSDSCPVLLKPSHEVYEHPIEDNRQLIHRHQKGKQFFEIIRAFYQDLKYNFATPFALVETLGFWYGLWMGVRTLAPTLSLKLKKGFIQKLMPVLATEPRIQMESNHIGIPFTDQVFYAESALRMIGLTENFSRLLILCGHGSATENNPYASALDCGACGGNHGGPNAKILAAILNDSDVRTCLKNKGITIPQDTLCMAAEHNTTTDEVVIYDYKIMSESRKQSLEQLKIDLAKAGDANSQSRCSQFGLKDLTVNARNQVLKRSSDWAEVRPEWGRARNAAFIVGPRTLTKKLDLHGRCFLHSYDWTQDENSKSLETILTAPMVVAEWINTQYFFSTIDNVAYGSGSKITHNIAGKIGLMQGNGSDLMHGLPLQSVNSTDDKQYHEPMRLQVVVYAPCATIESIIEKQPILKTLFFNNWVILIAIDPADNKPYRLIERENGKKSAHFKELKIGSKMTEPNLRTGAYMGKSCLLATMHDKQKAISPSFSNILQLQIEVAKIDTDQLGTFTGEIERKGSALDCVRQKCELAMNKTGVDIGIASEGSFGPHPFIPFIACDHEILYFIDRDRGFHLYQSLFSSKTNYYTEAISDSKRLKEFADQLLFPSHGLIVRPNKCQTKSMIFKGIQTLDKLEEAFIKCCRASIAEPQYCSFVTPNSIWISHR